MAAQMPLYDLEHPSKLRTLPALSGPNVSPEIHALSRSHYAPTWPQHDPTCFRRNVPWAAFSGSALLPWRATRARIQYREAVHVAPAASQRGHGYFLYTPPPSPSAPDTAAEATPARRAQWPERRSAAPRTTIPLSRLRTRADKSQSPRCRAPR